jgi:hypothetical protein
MIAANKALSSALSADERLRHAAMPHRVPILRALLRSGGRARIPGAPAQGRRRGSGA